MVAHDLGSSATSLDAPSASDRKEHLVPVERVGEPRSAGQDLGARVARGFAWSMAGAILMQLSRIVFGIVLARLLTPHEYGLAAMALVFSNLVLFFSDLSLSTGLVQREEITEEDKATVFWTSVAVGAVLMFGGAASAGLIASFYGQPAVRPLLAVLSVSFFITALQPTHSALLQREMNFKAISVRLTAGTFVGGVGGVIAAGLGYGAWALVVQQLLLATTSTALLWKLERWRPTFTYSVDSLRDLGSFGFRLLGSKLLNYVKGNADNVMVGRFLGSAALGTYAVAYNIMMLPVYRLIVPAQESVYPALARMQDDSERLLRSWLRTSRLIASIMVPGMVTTIIIAPELVRTLLGSRWSAVAPVLQLLAVAGAAYSLSAVASKLLTAVNRAGILLVFSIFDTVTAVAAFGIGIHWGVIGLATAYAISSVPVQGVLVLMTARTIGAPGFTFLRSLVGVSAASLPMAAIELLTRWQILRLNVAAPLVVVAVVSVGAAVYVGMCWLVAPEARRDARLVLTKLRPAPAAE